MQKRYVVGILCIAILAVALTTAVFAQSSPNFDLSWSAFTAGGGIHRSANNEIRDAVGQMVGASSTSASALVVGGFFGPAPLQGPLAHTYLPLVLR